MKWVLLIMGFWTMNGCNAIFRRAWIEVVMTLIGMVFVTMSVFIFTMDAMQTKE